MDGITARQAEAEETPETEPDGYVCPPCQRGRHLRCSDPACECCLGGDE